MDFAVWNTEQPLEGFVVPDHYAGERWKLYTADPLAYSSAELRALMLSRSLRTAEPRSGRIDWDVDGALRGNWFLAGTDGYTGDRSNPKGYWVGHLAFAPDLYDPSRWIVSMGDYPVPQDASTQVSATQFYTKLGTAAPEAITPESGLIKLELVREEYLTPDGSRWNRRSFVPGPTVGSTGSTNVLATALVQLISPRTLKFEVFPGKTADQVTSFTANAKIYTR